MNKPRILVCVLCGPERYQWPAPGLMMRLIEAARLRDIEVDFVDVYGVYGYDAARNRAVQMFLATDADWLCMCDNDNIPPADFIPRVLEFANSRPDVDVVPLPYYIRPNPDRATTSLCVGWHATEPNSFNLALQLQTGWQEIHVGGAGCMFTKRRVLSTVGEPWFCVPEFSRRENLLHGAGEDFDFCKRARAAGFRIWTNGALLCDHLHTVSLSAIARELVVREDRDIKFLRSLGMNIPKTVHIPLAPADCELVR